jgi:hypothetical protein
VTETPARSSDVREALDLIPRPGEVREAMPAVRRPGGMSGILGAADRPISKQNLDHLLSQVVDPTVYEKWCTRCGFPLKEKRRCQVARACDRRTGLSTPEQRLAPVVHPDDNRAHPAWLFDRFASLADTDLGEAIHARFPSLRSQVTSRPKVPVSPPSQAPVRNVGQ